MSEFPLNIEDKEDHPTKVAKLVNVPSKFYESAQELNKKKRALEELYVLIGEKLGVNASAKDSEKLGGELPSYYAQQATTYTQNEVDDLLVLFKNQTIQLLLDNPDVEINSITELLNQMTTADNSLIASIADKVSYTTSQSLSNAQQIIAQTNIGLEATLADLLKKSIAEYYTDIDDLYLNQSLQKEKLIYRVDDASGHTLVDEGYAYFEYLGTTNGDESDYKLISKEIIISNLDYKLLFKTASTSADFKIHNVNPLNTMKWLIIDNGSGIVIHEGVGVIEADLTGSSGDCSVYIEVDEDGLGITSFVSYYGDGDITYFDFNVVPKLETLIIYALNELELYFQGIPTTLKSITLFNGGIFSLNMSQLYLLETVVFSGGISFSSDYDISNSPLLKTYSSDFYSANFNVSNHRIIEVIKIKDTVSTELDSNINNTYLPNLTTLNIFDCNYYTLDLTTRDLSNLIEFRVKVESVIGFNSLTALKKLYIKSVNSSLTFSGMDIENLQIEELPNTILDLKPLANLRSFSLRYAGHSNLTEILIDNGSNALLTKFDRISIPQGYSGGGDGIVNVKVDNPTDANNEVAPYLPVIWQKQYNGYDVLNFV